MLVDTLALEVETRVAGVTKQKFLVTHPPPTLTYAAFAEYKLTIVVGSLVVRSLFLDSSSHSMAEVGVKQRAGRLSVFVSKACQIWKHRCQSLRR